MEEARARRRELVKGKEKFQARIEAACVKRDKVEAGTARLREVAWASETRNHG